MKNTAASLLTGFAILSFIIAAIAAFFGLTAFIERSKYGAGLMFADAEIFPMAILFLIANGLICPWGSRRIKKNSCRLV